MNAPSDALHFLVPAGIDDPGRPSGGNRYDRRLSDELQAAGHPVREHLVTTDAAAVLAALPDHARVLVDGLVAHAEPDALVAAARRLRLTVLLHLLTADPAERAALGTAAAVVTTSRWGRARAIKVHDLRPALVHVAHPGADLARPASGSSAGTNLLCVAVVAPHKGQDVLLTALATMRDRPWRLVCVGSLERDPAFVGALQRQAKAQGIADRVTFAGPLTDGAVQCAYATADVLVHPSRGEMYGMVIVEALAHGLPVIASDVGGVIEALGSAEAGLLVAPGDPRALAAAVGSWLSDEVLRAELRRAARLRRPALPTWAATAHAVGVALGLPAVIANRSNARTVPADRTQPKGTSQ